MKRQKRNKILMRSPKLIWNLLARGRYDFTYDLMPIEVRRMSMAKRLNLLKAGVNLLWRRTTPWNWPFNMQIELTNFCNLKCPVCPIGAGTLNRRPTAMSLDLFEQLMDQAGRYLLTAALFAWGEPLLHPQLAEILRIAARAGIATRLSTNGQNLDNEKITDALLAHPPAYLIVAIDGLSDETNSAYRVGAKLTPILGGVHRLAEAKQRNGLKAPVLHMRYLVMKHNQHELERVREFARSNRFELLTIRTLSTIDSPCDAHRALIPDDDEYRAFRYSKEGRIHRDDFTCDYPFVFPTVLADGTLIACDQDFNAQLPLGVLAKDVSFGDLWFSRQAAEVRRIIRDAPETQSFCRNCPYADRTADACSIQRFWLHDCAGKPPA